MSEPFRDGLEAALERADRLADENEDLRSELERVREKTEHSILTEDAPVAKESPPPDSETARVMEHLDELARERDTSGGVMMPIVPEPPPKPSPAPHARKEVLAPRNKGKILDAPVVAGPDARHEQLLREDAAFWRGVKGGAIVTFVACLFLGILLAYALR